jgi:hypothetical protein
MRSFSAQKAPEKTAMASILVHGLTGTGKTTRALIGGKPFVICTEPKAEAHVLNLNPNATCMVPESCDDIMAFLEIFRHPDFLKRGYTRIVLDSYTELTEMLPNWILEKQAKNLQKADPTAAAYTTEIGRKISIEEYRPIQQWGMSLVNAIQLSGLPSIIIARSDAKEVGRIQKIVPAGLGSSARNMNSKLVPTVEARFDHEMQAFIWDSRPDEYSQRCGLPWVPAVFTGTADEFLETVKKPTAQTKANGEKPPPLPKEPKTAGEAISQTTPPPKREVSQEAADFVEGIQPELVTSEDIGWLGNWILEHKIDAAKLLRYFTAKDMLDCGEQQAPAFDQLKAKAFAWLKEIAADRQRLHNFASHINGLPAKTA